MSMPFQLPGGYICYPQPAPDEFAAAAQHSAELSGQGFASCISGICGPDAALPSLPGPQLTALFTSAPVLASPSAVRLPELIDRPGYPPLGNDHGMPNA
jgi:hypothetical protein